VLAISLFFFLSVRTLSAQENGNGFEITVDSFFDFGPPFHFYEIFVVRPDSTGSSIKKINITPQGQKCISRPTVEIAEGHLSKSPSGLLNQEALCKIPRKELEKKRKDCKHCLVFSGAIVFVQLHCGIETRLIRSDVLDRDMFDTRTRTPDRVSQTMQMLGDLRTATGKSPMDRPMFPDGSAPPDVSHKDDPDVAKLAAGGYDQLFPGVTDDAKLSTLYRDSLVPLPVPTIELTEIQPIRPEKIEIESKYPPIARLVNANSAVSFTAQLEADGSVSEVETINSPFSSLFSAYVVDVVKKWKFLPSTGVQQVTGKIQFSTNCLSKEKSSLQ
jgi:hypothetical protein